MSAKTLIKRILNEENEVLGALWFKEIMKKLISIIIPVFNEEKNIPLIYVEIINVWRKHINLSSSYDCEVIFVNDGSEDNSLAELEKISERDERVKIIDFSPLWYNVCNDSTLSF